MNRVNLELVGVGGQGILTSSQVIGGAALDKGLDVYMSEVHGMAQRGGVVVTTVKLGDKVYSPLVGRGDADVVLGFEPVETYRAIEQASESTWVVTNTEPIVPFTVSVGNEDYPSIKEDIIPSLEDSTEKLITLNAQSLAEEAGAAITQNIVLIGALTGLNVLPLEKEEMKDSVKDNVPEKFVDMNMEAFDKGYERTKELMDRR